MEILTVSDTHGLHHKLTSDVNKLSTNPENSMIIHAGDISNVGKTHEIVNFLNWFGGLNFKYKVFIAGNHDWGFVHNHEIADMFKEKGIIYLFDSMVELDGIKIYGSPWQPEFCNWAFNLKRGEEIAQKWALIPEGLDILVTHGPAFGILDNTFSGMRVGCEELYKRIMIVRPKIHIFGHIHYGYGYKEFDGITFINAANLGENYRYENKPIKLVLDENKDIVDIIVNL